MSLIKVIMPTVPIAWKKHHPATASQRQTTRWRQMFFPKSTVFGWVPKSMDPHPVSFRWSLLQNFAICDVLLALFLPHRCVPTLKTSWAATLVNGMPMTRRPWMLWSCFILTTWAVLNVFVTTFFTACQPTELSSCQRCQAESWRSPGFWGLQWKEVLDFSPSQKSEFFVGTCSKTM